MSDKMNLVVACAGRGLDEKLYPLFRQGQVKADLACVQAFAMHPHHGAAQSDGQIIDAVIDNRRRRTGDWNLRGFNQALHRFCPSDHQASLSLRAGNSYRKGSSSVIVHMFRRARKASLTLLRAFRDN